MHRLVVAVGITGLIASSAAAITYTVTMESNSTFYPRSIVIAVGDMVTWRNPVGGIGHTVDDDNGSFTSSGTIFGGNSFSHTYGTAGTFPYHCIFHGGINAFARGLGLFWPN